MGTIAEMSIQMAVAVEEQAQVFDQINEQVEHISSLGSDSLHKGELAINRVQQMERIAGELHELVVRFKEVGMSQSVAYYNEHAQAFLDETLHVDMFSLYHAFLPHLPEGALILNAGCGSDTRKFLSRGYRVTAFEASEKLASLAFSAISHRDRVRQDYGTNW